jgi:ABC-type transport system involved in multi-copper enzyme maturation permease subunit
VTFLPIVGRELCAESRRPFNYWLRVLGAGALTIVAALTFLSRLYPTNLYLGWGTTSLGAGFGGLGQGQNPFGDLGLTLFGNLNATIFVALWVLVPLLTADCINREKREGTLGLLFLTPLTSTGIVVGKSLAHTLRALTLYFTMLPVLIMPLMLGGVTMQDGLMAALLNLGALMLALAAGLLASAWTRDWLKCVAVAQLLGVLFAFAFMTTQQRALEYAVANAPPGAPAPVIQAAVFNATGGRIWVGGSGRHRAGFLSHLRELFAQATSLPTEGRYVWNAATGTVIAQSQTMWNDVWTRFPPSVHRAWFRRVGLLVLVCLGVLAAAVMVAGRSIERGWREVPPSASRQRVNAAFTQPVIGRSLLRRRLRRALERNPIGWLHRYSWHARLTKWGWCAFVVCIELLLASSWQDAWDAQFWIALLLLLGLTFSAAGSFRRERETGALELLLVTPLRAGQIIRGRLQGIRMQYLPSIATLLLAWFCLMQPGWTRNFFTPDAWERGFAVWLYLLVGATTSYVTLPVIGLYFSLRRMNHLVSWLCACTVGLLIPWLLFGQFDFILRLLLSLGVRLDLLLPLRGNHVLALTAALTWQLAAALAASALLRLNLTRRRFATN